MWVLVVGWKGLHVIARPPCFAHTEEVIRVIPFPHNKIFCASSSGRNRPSINHSPSSHPRARLASNCPSLGRKTPRWTCDRTRCTWRASCATHVRCSAPKRTAPCRPLEWLATSPGKGPPRNGRRGLKVYNSSAASCFCTKSRHCTFLLYARWSRPLARCGSMPVSDR